MWRNGDTAAISDDGSDQLGSTIARETAQNNGLRGQSDGDSAALSFIERERKETHVASWKITPTVWRLPLWSLLTPWFSLT